jgi:hypothetical protein
MQSEKPSFRASEVHYWCDQAGAGVSLNLATAYPSEASIERWLRTVILDRKLRRVRLVEQFALKHKASVELTFMVQRRPDTTSPGRVVLPPIEAAGRAVALLYDSSELKVDLETIALKDQGLQHYWGAQIYRLRLVSSGAIDTGSWQLDLCVV